MDWPTSLDVIVDYGEDDKREKSSKLLRSREGYFQFGPMAEYETSDGEKFWIISELLLSSRETHTPPTIPVEVIRKNAEIQAKIEQYYQTEAHNQKQQQTGLVLPPGSIDV